MEARASVGFDGPRTGMAAWLADPSPMGSLDYVSPEATIVTAFVVKSPTAIVDGLVDLQSSGVAGSAAEVPRRRRSEATGVDVRNDLAMALGSEFSLSLDGSAIPVPSWKLVTEVYDPAKLQAALQKFAEAYSRKPSRRGNAPLRISQEVVDGRTYYMIAGGDGSPLTEAHYTFADGYMIAGPSRVLLTARAVQVKTGGPPSRTPPNFIALLPRDHYNNFSAVIYQNLGTTLAPIISLFGGMMPARRGPPAAARKHDQEPQQHEVHHDRRLWRTRPISVATSGNLMGTAASVI